MATEFGIALLGAGTVGAAVARELECTPTGWRSGAEGRSCSAGWPSATRLASGRCDDGVTAGTTRRRR